MRRHLYLLGALALPPKIVESSYDWAQKIKNLPQRKAANIQVLSQEPILHGGLWLRDEKVLVLSPDGTRMRDFAFAGSGPTADRPAPADLGPFWKKPNVAPFTVSAHRIDYQGLWSVPVDFPIEGYDRYPGGSPLIGWSTYPPQLFYLPTDLKNFNKIEWSLDSEPLKFFFCDRFTMALVENLTNGLSRVVFFRGDNPQSYTIFDFGGAAQKSDLSGVLARNCFDFYFAGTFGLVRVRYASP